MAKIVFAILTRCRYWIQQLYWLLHGLQLNVHCAQFANLIAEKEIAEKKTHTHIHYPCQEFSMFTVTININLNGFGTRIQTIISHLAIEIPGEDENGDDDDEEELKEKVEAKITTT